MGALTKTASPSPPLKSITATSHRHDKQRVSSSNFNFHSFGDERFTEPFLQRNTTSDPTSTQTQLNQAITFGHQLGHMLPFSDSSQPLQAKAYEPKTKTVKGETGHADSNLVSEGLISPSMDVPPVQCGLFKKIGKGFKKIGKGIGKGVKGLGKKFVDIAPSLYTFGLDVTSALPGPIGQIGNAVRSVAGLDNSLLSGLIQGEGIESAMEDTVGSFLGGFNIPGMGGGLGGMTGGGGIPDLGGMFGGGMPALAGGSMLSSGMPQLGGLESLLGDLDGGSGGNSMSLLKSLLD